MLTLVHRLKGATRHEIPIDVDVALAPESFATLTVKENGGEERPYALEWVLPSGQPAEGSDGKKSKYFGHRFELRVSAELLERFVGTAILALARFERVPANKTEEILLLRKQNATLLQKIARLEAKLTAGK